MTQVQKIQVKGFRSLKDVAWEPDRLNVVIGANGSGKSNLLRALEMLQQSAAGKLRNAVLTEGGYRQLLWDHRAAEIAWTLKLAFGSNSEPDRFLRYDLSLGSPMSLLGGEFQVSKELLTDSGRPNLTEPNKPFHVVERDPNHAAIWHVDKLVAPEDTVPREGTILSALNLFGDPRIFLFRASLLSFGIYYDLVTHRGSSVREAAVARVERHVSPDGSNLGPVMHTLYSERRDFTKAVDAGMSAAFGEDFEELIFGPAADQRVQLRIRWKHLDDPVSAADLSDGTLRFLMLLAILANPEPGTLIAIDEPETGLRPRMFPIIAEFAASASERCTVVLTTHSPEVLDAFPSDCIPTTTVAECVDGETRLAKLDARDLERWLKEYSLGRLFKSGDLEALS